MYQRCFCRMRWQTNRHWFITEGRTMYVLTVKPLYVFLFVFQLAVEFGKECERLIDLYIQRVQAHVLFRVGKCQKCGPLSQAYNATTAVVCQQIFWPFVRSLFLFYFFLLIRLYRYLCRSYGSLFTRWRVLNCITRVSKFFFRAPPIGCFYRAWLFNLAPLTFPSKTLKGLDLRGKKVGQKLSRC